MRWHRLTSSLSHSIEQQQSESAVNSRYLRRVNLSGETMKLLSRHQRAAADRRSHLQHLKSQR
ncbi:hypothetical protein EYF80_003707 [Liparis tanakae]|uniref:Uncharacterized protein n=1 Tax=Liparis tanakae TaxID=230148 RepID=A0A4Z2J891_9TELE|nr:hypothetical protein EYF80_003707 [Liparis tanakae]